MATDATQDKLAMPREMTTVAYTCPFVPAELIAASGLAAMRTMPRGAAKPAMPPSQGICPFARLTVDWTCGEHDADAVILTTSCDQMRRAYEFLAARSRRPTMLLNVPSTWQTPAARQLYQGELRRMERFLVSIGGTAPTPARLWETMLQYDSARATLRKASADAAAADPRATRRLAIVGGPLLPAHADVFHLVHAASAQIVLDATETGEISLPPPLALRSTGAPPVPDDPLATLADLYLAIPSVFKRPNTQLYDYLAEQFAARGPISGIIFHRYLWCDKWHAELQRIRERFNIPVLDLDCDDQPSPQRRATRLAAFLEVLR
jgi:benzoyl-CoA reductase/2-hydroxyglutaryl-CoA dehydratase subunit BcrC/BadD/HgdB